MLFTLLHLTNKTTTAWCCAMLCATIAYPNKNPVDSIAKLLENPALHDTSRVLLLMEMSAELLKGDFNQALPVSQEALSISHSIHYGKGIARSNYLIASVYFYQERAEEAITYFEESAKYYKAMGNFYQVAEAFRNIGFLYDYRLGDAAKGYAYLAQAAPLYRKANQPKGLARLYVAYGLANERRGQFTTAITYIDSALIAYRAAGDSSGVAAAFHNIAYFSRLQGNYAKALRYYERTTELDKKYRTFKNVAHSLQGQSHVLIAMSNFKLALQRLQESITWSEKAGDRTLLADNYLSIATIHLMRDSLNRALYYYTQARAIFDNIKYPIGIVQVEIGLGQIAQKRRNYAEAAVFFEKALQLANEVQDIPKTVSAYVGLGKLAGDQQEYTKAIAYFDQALNLSKSMDSKPLQAEIYTHLADISYARKEYATAISYGQRALDLALFMGNIGMASDAALALSRAQEAAGDYKAALDNFKRYKIYNDSIVNALKDDQFNRLQVTLQNDELLRENGLLKTQIATRDSRIARQRTVLLALAIGLVTLLLWLWWRWRVRL